MYYSINWGSNGDMPGTLRIGMTRAQQSIDHERLFARCIFVDKEKERARIDFLFQVEQQYERTAAAHGWFRGVFIRLEV